MYWIDNIETTESYDKIELFNGRFITITDVDLTIFHDYKVEFQHVFSTPFDETADVWPTKFIMSLRTVDQIDMVSLSNGTTITLSDEGFALLTVENLPDLKDKMSNALFGMTVKESALTGLCINCKEPALPKCYSSAGAKEFKITGLCEECYDRITQ